MDLAEASIQLVRVLDLLGVAANVLLAGALAHARRFDPVGFLFLGVVSGLGGGMLRDTLLQAGTPVALTDPAYLSVALLVALFAYFVLTDGRWWNRSLRFLDAIALGTWGAVGAQKALNAGLGWLPAILLGTLTAVGGGMIRDVLVQRTPIVFGGSTLYATCASIAALVAVVLHGLTPPDFEGVTTLIAALVGGTLCLVAYRRDWRLPEAGTWTPRPRRSGSSPS
ncbi:MAG: TRIC cation channel family protein [Propionibacteriaceae bacterium]|nr:TRIC cation channel family protein [Propionibacteriaceae bacterium]